MGPCPGLTLLFLGKGPVLLFKSSTLLITPSTAYSADPKDITSLKNVMDNGRRPSQPLASLSSLGRSLANLALVTAHRGLTRVGAGVERRRRAPIGEKLSRGVVDEFPHPTPFPRTPSSLLCTFLAATAKWAGPNQTRLNRGGDAAAAPAADCPLGRAPRLPSARGLWPPSRLLLELQ